jgi:hypothetical protein
MSGMYVEKKKNSELVPPLQKFPSPGLCMHPTCSIKKVDDETIACMKIEPSMGLSPGSGVPQIKKKLDEKHR